MNESAVAITKVEPSYPDQLANPAFHPSVRYPEYPFAEISADENEIYEGVRRLFLLMGLDKENQGTPRWNPLKGVVGKGQKVVIKPNFVRHYHRLGKPIESVITHASVLRPIMDYVYLALEGEGEISVIDAPQGDANFNELVRVNGTKGLFDFYDKKSTQSLIIELRDLRKEWTPYKHGIIWDRIALPGDRKGYKTIVLDEESEFVDKVNKDYYGADPDRDRTKRFHHAERNRYNVAGSILDADVFISVPKLKVHRKVGVTLNIKNLVGINGEKNFLPHFTVGAPEQGGDEFSNDTWNNKVDRKLKDLFLWKNPGWGKYAYLGWHVVDKTIFRRLQSSQNFVKGDWYGNDTTWRAAVDLAKIIMYADKEGVMQPEVQRKYVSIVDGVIAGSHEGPLTPDPEYTGVLIGGFHPTIVDLFATKVMGMDWRKIKMLTGAVETKSYPLLPKEGGDYDVLSDIQFDFSKPLFRFTAPAGWIGHVELDSE